MQREKVGIYFIFYSNQSSQGKDMSLRVSGPQGFPFLHVLLDIGFQIVLNLVEHN